MTTAKIFESNKSQAIRLPDEYHFDTDEVAISKIGQIIIILPKEDKWNSFIQAIDMFSDDYMENGRMQDQMQVRESL